MKKINKCSLSLFIMIIVLSKTLHARMLYTACDCLPKKICPQILGSSLNDVKIFGEIFTCESNDEVRCCGASTSIVIGKSLKIDDDYSENETTTAVVGVQINFKNTTEDASAQETLATSTENFPEETTITEITENSISFQSADDSSTTAVTVSEIEDQPAKGQRTPRSSLDNILMLNYGEEELTGDAHATDIETTTEYFESTTMPSTLLVTTAHTTNLPTTIRSSIKIISNLQAKRRTRVAEFLKSRRNHKSVLATKKTQSSARTTSRDDFRTTEAYQTVKAQATTVQPKIIRNEILKMRPRVNFLQSNRRISNKMLNSDDQTKSEIDHEEQQQTSSITAAKSSIFRGIKKYMAPNWVKIGDKFKN